MATVNEKMTALADEIRELSGTTASKSIDAMTSDVDAANAEIAEQTELLEQIATALEGKAGGGSGEDVTEETNAYTIKLASLDTAVAALEAELEGKASVEVEVITITETDTSQIPFTLKRVTKTIGSYNGDSGIGGPSVGPRTISSHVNTYGFVYSDDYNAVDVDKYNLTLSFGHLQVASHYTFAVPYVAVFINDPTQPAIYEE